MTATEALIIAIKALIVALGQNCTARAWARAQHCSVEYIVQQVLLYSMTSWCHERDHIDALCTILNSDFKWLGSMPLKSTLTVTNLIKAVYSFMEEEFAGTGNSYLVYDRAHELMERECPLPST